MLSAGVPGCFATPAESRHEHQATFISWLSTVLNSVQDKLREALETADADEAGADAQKKDLEGKIEEAKAGLTAEEEAVAAREASLKEAAEALASAHAELKAKQKEQQQGEDQVAEAIKEKELLDKVLEEDVVGFLKKDEGYETTQAAERTQRMMPIAKRLGLDDSLLAALLPAASKPPAARGAFDIMVLGSLEESLRRRVAELQGVLEAADPSRKTLAAATDAAQASLRQAEETMTAAEATLSSARDQQKQAATGLQDAEVALKAFVDGRSEATSARAEKASALQNFVGYNMECFQLLCTKAAPAGA